MAAAVMACGVTHQQYACMLWVLDHKAGNLQVTPAQLPQEQYRPASTKDAALQQQLRLADQQAPYLRILETVC